MYSHLEADEMFTAFTSLMFKFGSQVGKPVAKAVAKTASKDKAAPNKAEKIKVTNVPELPKGFQVMHASSDHLTL